MLNLTLKLKSTVLLIIAITSFSFSLHADIYKGSPNQHVPVIITIDQSRKETPEIDKLGAITLEFLLALKLKASHIIVSQTILHNLLAREKNWFKGFNTETLNNFLASISIDITDNHWSLYKIPGSQLFLFFLKKLDEHNNKPPFENQFQIDHLEEIILPKKTSDLLPLIEPEDKLPPITRENFEFFFRDVNTLESDELKPVWDLYFVGHGSPGWIASLPAQEMQRILLFFNDHLQTGTFLLSSCYVGGENLDYFKFKDDINEERALYSLNYTLIPMGIEDSSTIATFLNFSKIFDITAHLGQGPEYTLPNLLKALTTFTPHDASFLTKNATIAQSIFGKDLRYPNIPQIILPGGIEIQTLTADKRINVINKVLVKTKELENNPDQKIITLPKKQSQEKSLIVLYPEIIKPTIEITAHSIASKNKNSLWDKIPLSIEILASNKDSLLERMYDNQNNFPFTYKMLKNLYHDSDFAPGFNYWQELTRSRTQIKANIAKKLFNKKQYYAYPNIISALSGEAGHFFKNIQLKELLKNNFLGVLHFIRDAFLDIEGRTSTKTFMIETLHGINDITPTLEAIRALNNINEPYPLEASLKGQRNIRLTKLIIQTTTKDEKLVFDLSFEVNDTAWHLSFDDNNTPDDYAPWHFEEVDPIYHTKNWFEKKILQKALIKHKQKATRSKYPDTTERLALIKKTKKTPPSLDKLLSSNLSHNIFRSLRYFPQLNEFISTMLESVGTIQPYYLFNSIDNGMEQIYKKIDTTNKILNNYGLNKLSHQLENTFLQSIWKKFMPIIGILTNVDTMGFEEEEINAITAKHPMLTNLGLKDAEAAIHNYLTLLQEQWEQFKETELTSLLLDQPQNIKQKIMQELDVAIDHEEAISLLKAGLIASKIRKKFLQKRRLNMFRVEATSQNESKKLLIQENTPFDFPFTYLLQFIDNNIGINPSPKINTTFLLKTLKGNNDLALTIQAAKALQGILEEKGPLEKNKNLRLLNIIIQIHGKLIYNPKKRINRFIKTKYDYSITFSISFLDSFGQAWTYNLTLNENSKTNEPQTFFWNFQEKNRNQHLQEFELIYEKLNQ